MNGGEAAGPFIAGGRRVMRINRKETATKEKFPVIFISTFFLCAFRSAPAESRFLLVGTFARQQQLDRTETPTPSRPRCFPFPSKPNGGNKVATTFHRPTSPDFVFFHFYVHSPELFLLLPYPLRLDFIATGIECENCYFYSR